MGVEVHPGEKVAIVTETGREVAVSARQGHSRLPRSREGRSRGHILLRRTLGGQRMGMGVRFGC